MAAVHVAALGKLAVGASSGLSFSGIKQSSSVGSSHSVFCYSGQRGLQLAIKSVEAGSHGFSTRRARGVCQVKASATESSLAQPPTVADTKAAFLQQYRRPIPNLYNSVLQELLVQQHLIRYNTDYTYDPVFALGFVTVFDQLMDGFPSTTDREAIFRAYIEAVQESPEQYRKDAAQLEEWAAPLDSSSLVDFPSRDGPVETTLKEVVARSSGEAGGGFLYSKFFAVGLFRLMDLAKASDPATLEKLCTAFKVNKLSVDRDLDVYRGLLNKLTQAKDLLKEFLDREKKVQAERERQKAEVKSE